MLEGVETLYLPRFRLDVGELSAIYYRKYLPTFVAVSFWQSLALTLLAYCFVVLPSQGPAEYLPFIGLFLFASQLVMGRFVMVRMLNLPSNRMKLEDQTVTLEPKEMRVLYASGMVLQAPYSGFTKVERKKGHLLLHLSDFEWITIPLTALSAEAETVLRDRLSLAGAANLKALVGGI